MQVRHSEAGGEESRCSREVSSNPNNETVRYTQGDISGRKLSA